MYSRNGPWQPDFSSALEPEAKAFEAVRTSLHVPGSHSFKKDLSKIGPGPLKIPFST